QEEQQFAELPQFADVDELPTRGGPDTGDDDFRLPGGSPGLRCARQDQVVQFCLSTHDFPIANDLRLRVNATLQTSKRIPGCKPGIQSSAGRAGAAAVGLPGASGQATGAKPG